MVNDEQLGGAFVTSLKRNNSKIREERAIMITEDAYTMYKRKAEDIEMTIKQIRRRREAMMDLSPTDAASLQPAKDFKAIDYVETDLNLSVELRQLEIQLDVCKERIAYLFTSTDK